MCSIEGFTGTQQFTIEQYTKFNKNRGPDATNHWNDGEVHLGHNLLAIAPQPKNKIQPFVTDKGNVLTYNGEIYGLPASTYDTEWLANKIENEGIQSLKYDVDGMWAFSWYEPSKQKLWLVRDHFGVKPLFYLQFDDNLFFSSTCKPLYAVLNTYEKLQVSDIKMKAFNKCNRFMPGNLVPYNRLRKLAPGAIRCYDLKKRQFVANDTLWGSDSNRFNLDMDLKWDPEELEDLITKSFQDVYRPGPKVKKTVALSGGLDSTLIASVLRNRKISATSCSWEDIGYNDSDVRSINNPMFNECDLAEQSCIDFGIEFNKSTVPHDFNYLMKEAYNALGLPMWDRNRVVPRYVNTKQAAENGNKVYFVGDGADELLTGYNGDFQVYYPSYANSKDFNKDHVVGQEWFPKHLFSNDHINNRQFFMSLAYGEGFCVVADHLAGAFGMESRVPFFHQTLAKYLLKIPGVYKLHVPFKHSMFAEDYSTRKNQRFWQMGHWKSILRDHMRRYYPKHVAERTRKIGFANPWDARDDEKNKEYAIADTNLVNLLMKELTFNED